MLKQSRPKPALIRKLKQILRVEADHWWSLVDCPLLYDHVLHEHLLLDEVLSFGELVCAITLLGIHGLGTLSLEALLHCNF